MNDAFGVALGGFGLTLGRGVPIKSISITDKSEAEMWVTTCWPGEFYVAPGNEFLFSFDFSGETSSDAPDTETSPSKL